jgi:hypothetical protein
MRKSEILPEFGRIDDRVRGFMYGYRNSFGPAKDFLKNKEFQKGWDEGKSLRIDELRAQANDERIKR